MNFKRNFSNWKNELNHILQYSDNDELEGYLIDFIERWMKNCYQRGHFDGAIDGAGSITEELARQSGTNPIQYEIDADIDRHYSESRWLEFSKEISNFEFDEVN